MGTSRPPGARWTRHLGYGGALALVAAAVAVLLLPLFDGPEPSGAARGAAVPRKVSAAPSSGAGTVPATEPALEPTSRPRVPGPAPAPAGEPAPCPSGFAGYRLSGGILSVTLRGSGRGYAAAAVNVERGPTIVQSTTLRGITHTFRFADLPGDPIQRVSVTTVTAGGMRTCDVRAV